VASPYAQGAATTAVVEQFPVRPHRLAQEDIEGLALALLDLCSGYECALRTVISMQRHLERVRQCDALSPEASLLLQELSRQLEGLTGAGGTLAERLRAAGQRLESLNPPAV
jgi:hypothetical protein